MKLALNNVLLSELTGFTLSLAMLEQVCHV